jgi:hypothetical protein
MSPEAHARLIELDAATREAREFYDYAAAVLPASVLREHCRRLGQAKAELIALLALRLRGGRDARGTVRTLPPWLRERVSLAYARARIGLGAPDPARLWEELARIEAAVAEACRRQATDSGDADCRRELEWVLPMLHRCRDEFAPAAGPAYSV